MKTSKTKSSSIKKGGHHVNSKTGQTPMKPTNSSSRKNNTYIRPQHK
jgi:hypothetical protein